MTDRLADYEPVQDRITRFRADHPDGRIKTTLKEHDDQHVLMYSEVWTDLANPAPSADGWAEEFHDGSPVNRQGWMLENAETSAIGRALANMAYSPKGNRPSLEDMQRAVARRENDDAAEATWARLLRTKGTDLEDQVRALGDQLGKELKKSAFRTDPQWRAQVDEVLGNE